MHINDTLNNSLKLFTSTSFQKEYFLKELLYQILVLEKIWIKNPEDCLNKLIDYLNEKIKGMNITFRIWLREPQLNNIIKSVYNESILLSVVFHHKQNENGDCEILINPLEVRNEYWVKERTERFLEKIK